MHYKYRGCGAGRGAGQPVLDGQASRRATVCGHSLHRHGPSLLLRPSPFLLHLGASLLLLAHAPPPPLPPFQVLRRLRWFVCTLFMDMPVAPPVSHSLSCSTLTPFATEDLLYSARELAAKNEDGVSVLYFLKTVRGDTHTQTTTRKHPLPPLLLSHPGHLDIAPSPRTQPCRRLQIPFLPPPPFLFKSAPPINCRLRNFRNEWVS
jgi:hypothetical protein